ncbi:kinesin motor domain-containing protein [Radiomyces spectabilis]|uniref:kinesin motor domain-containing protein n=1 Tax=Radiomyces spectabilis TaxID=64574 RepID=UPI00221E8733|nr:kinesin motor domain-containing protein [Radiomyces spectabilis]KAI8374523.1 kinesin motor domain-containing protein [Radiomyces spectabilis]
MLRSQNSQPTTPVRSAPDTPSRSAYGTPRRTDRTPNRTPHRTPQRIYGNRTPNRTPHRSGYGSVSRPLFRTSVRPPDFVAIAREERRLLAAEDTRSASSVSSTFMAYNPEKEPIKAYLRIRPRPPHHEAEIENPYLQIVDDLEVSMTPPEDSNAYKTRNRAPERYKFTKIFTEEVTQKDFFDKTTLPLIEDVLKGENALIFAYGVTNSGKTYSIMGTKEDTGLLPRTLDVIFNSTEGYLNESNLKPVMHSLVQSYEDGAEENRDVLESVGVFDTPHPGTSNPDLWEGFQTPVSTDRTVIEIDQKFEYGIWVSFAEIYTEKIYDLLEPPDRHLRRKPLSLKYEFRSGHKYIAGLKEVKVQSLKEAYAVLHEGQRNRAVFSTLMNHTSSRSHSIFTIRIVRVPIDDEDYVIEDPSYASVSKMSIVDLAGSERYRNTFNSGQRLKEAGNINKSLMVLGQCMETLRLNQLKAAIGKRQAVVPFRHSKLTELFKSSFEGDGKAVMVVNVNPFDTGFDENSHVMKFAAVAKDVATWRRIHPILDLRGISGSAKRPRSNMKKQDIGYQSFEELDTTPSTDEDDDDDGEAEDPFVDNLIHQLEDLRNKWIDAETRCGTMEAEIRQQVSQEMEVELRKMEEIYMSALKRENEMNEAQLKEHMDAVTKDTSGTRAPANEAFLSELYDRQKALTEEMVNLRRMLREHDTTKQSLLTKIADLEKDKRREQEATRQLMQDLKERDKMVEELSKRPAPVPDRMEEDNPFLEPSRPEPPKAGGWEDSQGSRSMDVDMEDPFNQPTKRSSSNAVFQRFLDLRKRLRRSIFKTEEYSPEADVILREVEQFKDVTFELVKETNMGKLLKLIAKKEFTKDPSHIKHRAKQLFKRYAQLTIPVLAPPKTRHPRDSVIMVSVDAGKEEDLISDMRDALDTLQEENLKLKNRLKTMQDGHRRLKEAFERTRDLGDDILPEMTPPNAVSTAPSTSNPSNAPESSTKSPQSPNPVHPPVIPTEPVEQEDHPRESAMFSPVLEAPMLPLPISDEEDEEIAMLFRQEGRPKRRRKLRVRQTKPDEDNESNKMMP